MILVPADPMPPKASEANQAPQGRAVVIDDDSDFCDLVKAYLALAPGWTCVATFTSGERALAECERLKPDVALVDALMPGLWGVEITQRLKLLDPRLRVGSE